MAVTAVILVLALGGLALSWSAVRDRPVPTAVPVGPAHRHPVGAGTMSPTAEAAVRRARDGRWVTQINPELLAVSSYPPGASATPDQWAAAAALIDRTHRGIARYADPEAARADGFVPVDGTHWVSERNVTDGRVLDPERPESLVYLPTGDDADGHGLLLAGAMFVLTDRRPGPQVGGPLTVWHFHRFSRVVCFVGGAFPTGFASGASRCRRGTPSRVSPEMLHVWLANPEGPFAHDMSLSEDTDLGPVRSRLDELTAPDAPR